MGHFVIQISSYAQVGCKGKTEQCVYNKVTRLVRNRTWGMLILKRSLALHILSFPSQIQLPVN